MFFCSKLSILLSQMKVGYIPILCYILPVGPIHQKIKKKEKKKKKEEGKKMKSLHDEA